MGRLVVIVVLVVLAVWLVRKALRAAARNESERRASDAAPGELVRCAHCGMHLPRGEAREHGGAMYCSEEHARLGKG